MEKIKSSPRDVLMHIFVMITLYFSVGSFLTIVFQSINIWFSDPINSYYDPAGNMRWALALMVVIFPTFLWASRFLHKDLKQNPEKSELRVRKWLIYFTIFAAAGFILGDIVTLIYRFLEGELTVRFVLKVFSVLLVAAAVFGYYLYELKRKPGEFSQRAKTFVWVVSLIVLAAVVTGFILAGSPFKQRLLKFDRERTNDLQILQSQIINFWTQKDRLPKSLDELKDSISGFIPPTDPETGASYTYREIGKLSFDLCAKYNLSSNEDPYFREGFAKPRPIEPGIDSNTAGWEHNSGDFCFNRIIDPELHGKGKVEPKRPIPVD